MGTIKQKSERVLSDDEMYENKISFEEKFQNETLRPIIKSKHDLIIQIVRHYNKKKLIKLKDLSVNERNNFLNIVLFKETHFTNEIKGVIIGNFTTEEYYEYLEMEKDMNKRIVNIIKERLKTNLSELL